MRWVGWRKEKVGRKISWRTAPASPCLVRFPPRSGTGEKGRDRKCHPKTSFKTASAYIRQKAARSPLSLRCHLAQGPRTGNSRKCWQGCWHRIGGAGLSAVSPYPLNLGGEMAPPKFGGGGGLKNTVKQGASDTPPLKFGGWSCTP